MSERTDLILLTKIRENQGLSKRELADSLGWNKWKVDGSLRRMRPKGMIGARYRIHDGKAVLTLCANAGEDKNEEERRDG